MQYQNTIEFAKQLDATDPLKHFRERFYIPQHKRSDCIYFTGNSLGLQPKTVAASIDQELQDWASLGVEGHFSATHPWFSYHEMFPALLNQLTGALPEELVVMNQLTVNLHLLLTTFYRPTKDRFKIICEARAFPSDQYALESQVMLHGFDPEETIIKIEPRPGEQIILMEDIQDAIKNAGSTLALVIFGGVNYYTGQVFDMQAITNAAHKQGAYAGFDLAHAIGNIELNLHDWQVDFACWCSYKYLNSGPGGVAGTFIHKKHVTNTSLPRLAGWWGYEKKTRFQMKPGFQPIATAEGWQLSNAPILSMAAHKAALEIFEDAGMDLLYQKSQQLTGYLFFILDEINSTQSSPSIQIVTPRGEKEHGCQVSMFMLKNGREVFEALSSEGVIADWREPNVIRVAPVPLYNSFEDVWKFGDIIHGILNSKS